MNARILSRVASFCWLSSSALLPRAVLLSTVLLITACQQDDKTSPDGPQAAATLSGIFLEPGYGNVVVFKDQRFEIYTALEKFCWRTEQGPIASLAISEASFSAKGSQLSIKMPGASAFPRQLTRLAGLPATCQQPVAASSDPLKNFEMFWHSMHDLYAFFPERNIDWQQQYRQGLAQLNAQSSDEQLFSVLAGMLSHFNDSHVSLQASINGSPQFFHAAPANILSTYALSQDTHTDTVMTAMLSAALELMQSYAGQELKQAVSGQPLWWTKSDNNVGYIMLAGLAGFAGDTEDVAADLAAAQAAFALMMQDLANTDAIIIDNRFNQGGYDDIGSTLVRHFLSKPQQVLQKQVNNRLAKTQPLPLQLTPIGAGYQKPLFLVNSSLSVSAAETFSLMLKSAAQLKILGSRSNGALSDILSITLPNGWQLGLSNERYLDNQGNSYEVSGVPADHELPVFAEQDLWLARVPAYDKALQLAGKPHAINSNFAEVSTLIEQALADKILPGIAVAALKNGQPVYQQSFGEAAKGRPVSLDTPFFLASVSKAFNGTLAAVLASEGVVDVQAEVSGTIGFMLNPPDSYQTPILLRHLLSHTSGISDSAAFLCGYFLSEDGSSLYNAISGSEQCASPAFQPLPAFLANYLQQHGSLYSNDNYLSGPTVQPGRQFHYSNIGTAAAALWLAEQTGQAYPELFRSRLSEPLGLFNTQWQPDGDAANHVASRYQKADGDFVPYPAYGASSWPDGSLTASLSDMIRFSSAVLDPKHPLLSAPVKQLMFTPLYQLPLGQGIGYFWQLDHQYALHSGGDPGVSSLLLLDRSQGDGIILLINTGELDSPALAAFTQQLSQLLWHSLLNQR